MATPLEALLELLDLEDLEVNIFRGRSPREEGRQRVFGGLVLAQALRAADRTVEDPERSVHSLHAYFLRPGDLEVPILYDVDRIRDGRSFSTRRVRAIQHGRAIFNMSASYHVVEPGIEHQFEMPDVPPPEELPGRLELAEEWGEKLPPGVRDWLRRERPIEERYAGPAYVFKAEKHPPQRAIWFRAAGPLPDDPATHRCVLAYASDLSLLDTATLPHGLTVFDGSLLLASLDHAMWFHRPFRADGWLLYAQDSPSASGARGFSRGSIYTREGILVASVSQEGLLRPVRRKA
ncbi:MAG: acyl-CoA thioesterase II [Myxococcota bacterium]